MKFEELKKNGNLLSEDDFYTNGIYSGSEYVFEYNGLYYISTKHANTNHYSGISGTEEMTRKELLDYIDERACYEDLYNKLQNKTPQDRWQKKAGYVSKSYKLKKELVDSFRDTCEKVGKSQAEALSELMNGFIKNKQ